MTIAAERKSRRGFVLVAVLWLAALVSVLVAALLAQGRTSLTAARTGVEESLADAMLTGAVERLAQKYRGGAGSGDGGQSQIAVSGGSVTVAVQDANGLIDINRVSPTVIEAIGDASKTHRAVEEILSRRGDAAGETPRPFRAPAEIADLPGANPALAAFFADYGTLFSDSGKINPMTAPVVVLATLPGVDLAMAEQIVTLRRQPQITPDTIMNLLKAESDFVDPKAGRAIDAYLEAHVGSKVGSGLTKSLRVTIVFGGGGTSPYRIVDWRPWASPPAWVHAAAGAQG